MLEGAVFNLLFGTVAEAYSFCKQVLAQPQSSLGIYHGTVVVTSASYTPVSYTHLDVYKRQR